MFENLKQMWAKADGRSRLGMGTGAALILALVIGLAVWALRSDYQVLFSDLDPSDAATLVAELDKLKVPYRLGADETTILVDASQVHATRLKLMGKGLNLRGGVGFEIFNNTDFGMTEFAQKINYQRALQGELARTIMAFDEVRFARVHLVMPESSLFKRATQRPKASVTLAMKEAQALEPEQVLGIQRLVAASMPDMEPGAVTIVDQRGVALTRAGDGEDSGMAGRLGIKHEIETYLARKVVAVLDKAFGPGQAIVSVDVTLNHDSIKVTREDVLPMANQGAEALGVVMRRRSTTPAAAAEAGRGQMATTDIEYQSGRRVEQIVSNPGSIKRLSVGVLLPHTLPGEKLEQIRQVLAMAIGVSAARGDEIAISSVDQFGGTPAAIPSTEPAAPAAAAQAQPAPTPQPAIDTRLIHQYGGILAGLLLLILAATIATRQMRRRRAAARLTPEARERLLTDIRGWLDNGSSSRTTLERAP